MLDWYLRWEMKRPYFSLSEAGRMVPLKKMFGPHPIKKNEGCFPQ